MPSARAATSTDTLTIVDASLARPVELIRGASGSRYSSQWGWGESKVEVSLDAVTRLLARWLFVDGGVLNRPDAGRSQRTPGGRRRDAVLFAKPRIHLQHVLGFPVNFQPGIGVRFGVRNYANHAEIAPGKDHVQRNLRVVHPEGSVLGRGKNKQHPCIRRQFRAVHEAAFTLRSGLSELDIDRGPLLIARSDERKLRTLAMCTLEQRQHCHR